MHNFLRLVVLFSLSLSAQATITILYPASDTVWYKNNTVALNWTTTSFDSDLYPFRALLSSADQSVLAGNLSIADSTNATADYLRILLPGVQSSQGYVVNFVNTSNQDQVYATTQSFEIADGTVATSSASASMASATASTLPTNEIPGIPGTQLSYPSAAATASNTGSAEMRAVVGGLFGLAVLAAGMMALAQSEAIETIAQSILIPSIAFTLMPSAPPTPTSPFVFPRPIAGQGHAMAPRRMQYQPTETSLAQFIVPGISKENLVGGVEEYVYRSLLGGKRVKEWCRELNNVLGSLPPDTPLLLHFRYPPLSTLCPFIILPTRPHFPVQQPSLPPSLISPSAIDNLSRRQLIDTLVKLSKEKTFEETCLREELVLELCLEYVGRRWRTAVEKGEDVVEAIGKKLTEILFELQVQGQPSTVQLIIIPALQRIRFQLGFVTSSQLVVRFNSEPTAGFDPSHKVLAWLTIRLRTGHEPQALGEELLASRARLSIPQHKDIITSILTQLSLLDRDQVDSEDGPLVVTPSTPTSPTTRSSPKKKTFSLLSPRSTRLATPKWFSHRQSSSSSSSLPFSAYQAERRPSLPIISSPWTPPTSDTSSSVLASSSSLRLQAPIPPGLLSEIMTFSEPEEIKLILVDYLLEAKYFIKEEYETDWFLGSGRQIANDVLSGLECKLVGKKDVMGIRTVFNELRAGFHLPPLDADFQIQKPRRKGGDTPKSQSFNFEPIRERDVSFDLDQYLSDITPPPDMRRRPSASAGSMMSMSTSYSDFGHRFSRMTLASRFSTFTIREATRGNIWPAVEYEFPTRDDEEEEEEEEEITMERQRMSRSTPNLLEACARRSRIQPMTPPEEVLPPMTKPAPEGKLRRKTNRHFTIVDGEHVSPNRSDSPALPLTDAHPADQPLLERIVALLRKDRSRLQVEEVEECLAGIISSEIERLEREGKEWDWEVRKRLSWLVQQVESVVPLRPEILVGHREDLEATLAAIDPDSDDTRSPLTGLVHKDQEIPARAAALQSAINNDGLIVVHCAFTDPAVDLVHPYLWPGDLQKLVHLGDR
ncbi:hypothetical protein P7C73_g2461, partial [Tremellales sp. Uapishka_1]